MGELVSSSTYVCVCVCGRERSCDARWTMVDLQHINRLYGEQSSAGYWPALICLPSVFLCSPLSQPITSLIGSMSPCFNYTQPSLLIYNSWRLDSLPTARTCWLQSCWISGFHFKSSLLCPERFKSHHQLSIDLGIDWGSLMMWALLVLWSLCFHMEHV